MKKRFEKELRAAKDRGECLHVQELKDPNEEAQYIADQDRKEDGRRRGGGGDRRAVPCSH